MLRLLAINVLALFVAATAAGNSHGQTEKGKPKPETIRAEAEASALLSLAKAKRERETKSAVMMAANCSAKCFSDRAEAERQSKKTGCPVIYWVGIRCSENKEIAAKLSDFLHCQIDAWNGSPEPRVIFTDSENRDWAIGKAELDAETPEQIRQALKIPQAKRK